MIVCDLCSKTANLHICDKCYDVVKNLLEMYEEKINEKPKPKKRGRPKKVVKQRAKLKKQIPLKDIKKEISKEETHTALSKC